MINLFENKESCCGCGACVSACPKGAISFENDEYGFPYPAINRELCIECGMCNKVCAFQNKEKENTPIKAYAAALSDDEKIMLSTSGGAFAALAEEALRQGGVVFGVAMEKENGLFKVHHIAVEDIGDLHKIIKSKYVQSATEDSFIKAEEYLKNGRLVLYSGTPCQIAGLKGYLRRDYENLITIDLVCHGVPNQDIFRDHISSIEKRENITVTNYYFRYKSKGWGSPYRAIDYTDKSGNSCHKSFIDDDLKYSYMYYFKNYYIYRDCCYKCRYANANRPADISLGDFWGFEKLYSAQLSKNGGLFSNEKGISGVILNTEKGINYFEALNEDINIFSSSFKDISDYNTQLRTPSPKPADRDEILNTYKNEGFEGIDRLYQRIITKKKVKNTIKKFVPTAVIKKIKG